MIFFTVSFLLSSLLSTPNFSPVAVSGFDGIATARGISSFDDGKVSHHRQSHLCERALSRLRSVTFCFLALKSDVIFSKLQMVSVDLLSSALQGGVNAVVLLMNLVTSEASDLPRLFQPSSISMLLWLCYRYSLSPITNMYNCVLIFTVKMVSIMSGHTASGFCTSPELHSNSDHQTTMEYVDQAPLSLLQILVPPWHTFQCIGGCGNLTLISLVFLLLLMGFCGLSQIIRLWPLKRELKLGGLVYWVVCQIYLGDLLLTMLRECVCVLNMASLPNIWSLVRESPSVLPLFQRATYPDRFLSDQRLSSLLESFQTAFKRVSCGLLKTVLSRSSFGECSTICVKHWDPVVRSSTTPSEDLSLYYAIIIVFRVAFYPFTYGLKTPVKMKVAICNRIF